MNWIARLFLGEWAKVVDALQRWMRNEAVDIFVTVQDRRLRITVGPDKKLTIELLRQP